MRVPTGRTLRGAAVVLAWVLYAREGQADEVATPPEETVAVASVKTSLRYELERIEVHGNLRTREQVVLRYVPFRPGRVLDMDDPELELLRYRLLGTGFFRTVSLSLRKGSRRGAVVLRIDVEERNTIVVNDVWLGLSATATDEGKTRPLSAYGGADIAEANLFGSGVTLGGAFAVADGQYGVRLRFLDPAFRGTSWMAQAMLLHGVAREFYGNRQVRYDDPFGGAERVEDFAVARYTRTGGLLGVGRDLSVSSQLWADYRLERISARLPLAASHLRGMEREPLVFDLVPGTSYLSSLRLTFVHDTRDAPVLPTRGWHLSLAADTSLAPLGTGYPYEKLQLRALRWWPLPWGHVARLEFFVGAIGGDAPVFEKFYVADFSDLLPDRVLDLNFDRRPAPNFFKTAISELRTGEYAGRWLGEYRIPLYRSSRAIYGVDFFGLAGVYSVASRRDLADPVRGFSGLARIPVDLTFNVGLRMDTKAGGFLLAFANVLGFLPAFRGGP
ncbi:MAG: BamA/TamA family outer membrane protein [Myxococcales bacterium]|nr:BamA/TamA family outer membrane protein [Myxococcales bacterium]